MTIYLTSFSVSKFYDLPKTIIRREIKFLTSTCLLKRAFCGVICISGGFQAASISEVSLTLRSKVFPAVRSLYKASACRATNVSCGKTIHWLHETANIQDLMCPYARTLKLTLYVLDDYKSVRPQFETICMVSKKNCFSYELNVNCSLSLACKLKSHSIFQCTASCDRVVTQ